MLVGCLAAQPAYADPGFDASRTVCSYPSDNSIALNVADKFGGGKVDADALARAVDAANSLWASGEMDKNIILEIGAGKWVIDGNPGIDLSNLNSAHRNNSGWLVFRGTSLLETQLVFSDISARGFYGRNVHRLHLCNLHLTRDRDTVTQGVVAGYLHAAAWATDPDPKIFGDQPLETPGSFDDSGKTSKFLVVDLHPGFPDIAELYNHNFKQGRFTKRWRYNAAGEPYRVQDDIQQSWTQFADLGNGRWVLGMRRDPGYAVGETIAIKSKLAREPIFIVSGDSVIVENVLLTRASRMLFRKGVDNILFRNVSIDRHSPIGGRIPFLSTAAGGAQMGQPNEGPLRNVVVERMLTKGTGDDPLAAFDVVGLRVSDSEFHDSFARGILLNRTSTTPCIKRTLVNRSPLLAENPSFKWGCKTDHEPPPSVSDLTAEPDLDGIMLTWSAVPVDDQDGFVIQRSENREGKIEIAFGVQDMHYKDISAEANVSYEYSVVALDTSKNRSAATTITITAAENRRVEDDH